MIKNNVRALPLGYVYYLRNFTYQTTEDEAAAVADQETE